MQILLRRFYCFRFETVRPWSTDHFKYLLSSPFYLKCFQSITNFLFKKKSVNFVKNVTLRTPSVCSTPLLLQQWILDVQKGIDNIWYVGPIKKRMHISLPINITKLVYSYLTDRTITVKTGKALSDSFTPQAGVPQGLVDFLLYADDTVLLSVSYKRLKLTYLEDKIHLHPRLVLWCPTHPQ